VRARVWVMVWLLWLGDGPDGDKTQSLVRAAVSCA